MKKVFLCAALVLTAITVTFGEGTQEIIMDLLLDGSTSSNSNSGTGGISNSHNTPSQSRSTTPAPVQQQVQAVTENDFDVELTADYTGARITRYKGQGISNLVIPETIQTLPVKEIGSEVFRGNSTITSVTLPSGIEKIGKQAFQNCRNLITVTIPTNVARIEFARVENTIRGNRDTVPFFDSFHNCERLLFSTQAALKTIGYPGDFYHEYTTMYGTSIGTYDVFTRSRKQFGDLVFTTTTDYTGLVVINYGRKAENYYSGFDRSKVFSTANLSIPSIIEGMPIKEIGPDSMNSNYSITVYNGGNRIEITGRLEIPEGVEAIRQNAFFNTDNRVGQRFISVILPSTLKRIEASAFRSCRNLNSIRIPRGLTILGDSAFEDCVSLAEVEVLANVKKMGDRAFANCARLTSVTLPAGIEEIGAEVFSGCTALTSITLPPTLRKVGNRAFSGTNITTFTVPDTLVEFDGDAFAGMKLALPVQAELRRKGYKGSF